MRFPILILGIFSFIFGPPSVPEQAQSAWGEGKYAEAVRLYREAIPAYLNQEELMYYNMGQAWMASDSLDSALTYFQKVSVKNYPYVASNGLNNIGVITASAKPQSAAAGASQNPQAQQAQQIDQALVVLQEALRANPDNETARYNYELLMKRKQNQQDQQQNPPPEDEKQDDPEKEPGEGNKPPPQPQQKPSEKNGNNHDTEPVDKQQAEMMMEALKENEKRFIQQLKKKPVKRPERDGKPQW